jgi:low affinity Fe/Cu permease
MVPPEVLHTTDETEGSSESLQEVPMSVAMRTDQEPKMGLGERIAGAVTRWSGTTAAAVIAMLSVVIWIVTGPIFRWSDTWQLVMNTLSSIIAFLMVFLIQRSQNKDTLAIHLKLNELIAAVEGTSKGIVGVEELSEGELELLRDRYQRWVERVTTLQATRRGSQR